VFFAFVLVASVPPVLLAWRAPFPVADGQDGETDGVNAHPAH
jgi:hypothetical protein